MIIRCITLSLLAISLSACKIYGTADKGPFKAGSSVTATELDAQANPINSSSRSTVVDNDQGDFLVTRINWDGWTEVTASGQYFDEAQGIDSTTTIQLNAISNKDNIFDTVNTHIFSTLAASRIRQLVSEGQSIDNAWATTQTEIANTFGLNNLDIDGVEQLDATDGSSANAENNAILLLFSGAFLDAGGDTVALESLSTDFADDAQFNGAAADIFNSIALSAGKPNFLNTISANLVANGATNPPNSSNIQILPDWVIDETVTPNQAPVANAQNVIVEGGVSTTITLTGTDADNETLSFAIISDPSNGIATINGAEVSYTPTDGFSGADSFAFTASDGTDTSNTAIVSITVNPVIIPNIIPVADSQIISVDENSTNNSIILTATDDDNDVLEYRILSAPAKGSATLSGNVVSYIPNPESIGSDSFTFVANDGTADSAPATVSITINEQAELPRFNVDLFNFGWDRDTDVLRSFDLNQFNIGGVATSWELLESPSNADIEGFPIYEIPSNDPSNPIPLTFNVGTPKDATQTTDMFSLTNEGIFTRNVLGEGLPDTRMIIRATNASGDSTEIPVYLCINVQGEMCEAQTRLGPLNNPGIQQPNPPTIVTATIIKNSIGSRISLSRFLATFNPSNLPITLTIAQQPTNGSAIAEDSDDVSYTPNTDFLGEDSFIVIANNGMIDSAPITINVNVIEDQGPPPSNLPPIVQVTGTVSADIDFGGGEVKVLLAGNVVTTEPLIGRSFDISVSTTGVSFGSVGVEVTSNGDGLPLRGGLAQFLQPGKTIYDLGEIRLIVAQPE